MERLTKSPGSGGDLAEARHTGYAPCMKKALLPLIALLAAAPLGIAQSKAAPPKTPRLYVFDCGTLYATDTSNYQLKKEEVATATMSMLCFLIEIGRAHV